MNLPADEVCKKKPAGALRARLPAGGDKSQRPKCVFVMHAKWTSQPVADIATRAYGIASHPRTG